MDKEEFLKLVQTELKISKFSDYTLRNYLDFNRKLLEYSNKNPDIMPDNIDNNRPSSKKRRKPIQNPNKNIKNTLTNSLNPIFSNHSII